VNKFLFSKEKKEEKNMSATIGFGKFRERLGKLDVRVSQRMRQ
jgi:hypothetical protein